MNKTYTVKPAAEIGEKGQKMAHITLPKPDFFDDIPPEPTPITAAPLRISNASPDQILKKPMRSYGFTLVTK